MSALLIEPAAEAVAAAMLIVRVAPLPAAVIGAVPVIPVMPPPVAVAMASFTTFSCAASTTRPAVPAVMAVASAS